MFMSWHIRNLWPAAGGNQYVFGAVALTAKLNTVCVDNTCMAFQQGHATVHQQVTVDAIEPFNFAVLVGDQGSPVEFRAAQCPAESLGLLEVLGEVRAVHQQLFRHTANVDTGAAQVAAFSNGHPRAEARSKARRTHTAGTGTDHKQVKVVGHFSLQNRLTAYPKPAQGLSLKHAQQEIH